MDLTELKLTLDGAGDLAVGQNGTLPLEVEVTVKHCQHAVDN